MGPGSPSHFAGLVPKHGAARDGNLRLPRVNGPVDETKSTSIEVRVRWRLCCVSSDGQGVRRTATENGRPAKCKNRRQETVYGRTRGNVLCVACEVEVCRALGFRSLPTSHHALLAVTAGTSMSTQPYRFIRARTAASLLPSSRISSAYTCPTECSVTRSPTLRTSVSDVPRARRLPLLSMASH